jgi:hypothetical protein
MLATLYLLFEKIKEWRKRRDIRPTKQNTSVDKEGRCHCKECTELIRQNKSVFSAFKKP